MATTTSHAPTSTAPRRRASAGGVARVFAPLIARLDARSPQPRGFALRFWDGSELPAAPGAPDPPALIFRSPDALVAIIRAPGELGFSRAWVSGTLDVDGDLERAFTLTEGLRHVRPQAGDALRALRVVRRLGLLRRPVPEPPSCEARLQGRRHSRARDRDAITHHYDVSNDFYRRMLGPTMVYSCAYFASASESLDDAQMRKLDLICRKLELREGERLLDIGCGWGSLLIHAAREYGVRGVGVTVSEAQAELARERVRQAGLQDRLEIRLQDYRETQDGPYDKIASIGMFEHVGAENLALYLEHTHALLRPDGLFLNHGIVRPRPQPMNPDSFTIRYVFPDGELHTQGTVIQAYEAAGFELRDDESIRMHYAQTLRCWARNLDAHREEAIAEIGPERERVWRLHNVGAAIGFERGGLSVHQALLAPLEGAASAPLRQRSYTANVPG